jgi:hypothetical protein
MYCTGFGVKREKEYFFEVVFYVFEADAEGHAFQEDLAASLDCYESLVRVRFLGKEEEGLTDW